MDDQVIISIQQALDAVERAESVVVLLGRALASELATRSIFPGIWDIGSGFGCRFE